MLGTQAFSLFGTISLVGVAATIAGLGRVSGAVGTLGAGLVGLGTKLLPVGLGLTALSAATVFAGKNMVDTAMEFEKAMTSGLAIMDDVTAEQRLRMEKAARSVASVTRFSAIEAATAYYSLASAGMEAEEAVLALPVAARFAQAANDDLEKSTSLLVQAQNALGLTVKDDAVANLANLVRISDALVKTDTMAVGSTIQFAEALTNDAGMSLRLVNKDLEEGLAVLAAFASQGDTGAEAGTHLHMVLRDLQKANIRNREEWKKYGLTIYDASGEMRNMGDIVADLEVALSGMSDEEVRTALMALGFQDRAVKATQSLLGLSAAIKGYEAELRGAGGTTQAVAEKQLDNLDDKLHILQNRLQNVKITLGTELLPVVERWFSSGGTIDKFIKKLQGLADAFAALPAEKQDALVGLGAKLLLLGPAILLLKPVGLILQGLAGGLNLIGAALASGTLLSSIGALTLKFLPLAAVLGLIAAAVKTIFYMKFPELIPETSKTGAILQAAAAAGGEMDYWSPPGTSSPSADGGVFGVPKLHGGGEYQAPPGRREGLALLSDGEVVSPPGAGGVSGGHYTMDINVKVTGGVLDEDRLTSVATAGFMEILSRGMRIDNDRYGYAMSERRMFR